MIYGTCQNSLRLLGGRCCQRDATGMGFFHPKDVFNKSLARCSLSYPPAHFVGLNLAGKDSSRGDPRRGVFQHVGYRCLLMYTKSESTITSLITRQPNIPPLSLATRESFAVALASIMAYVLASALASASPSARTSYPILSILAFIYGTTFVASRLATSAKDLLEQLCWSER